MRRLPLKGKRPPSLLGEALWRGIDRLLSPALACFKQTYTRLRLGETPLGAPSEQKLPSRPSAPGTRAAPGSVPSQAIGASPALQLPEMVLPRFGPTVP